MTELTSDQLCTIIGGIQARPRPAAPPDDGAALPYHLRSSASLQAQGQSMPKWAAAMHDRAAKAFGSMTA